MRFDVHVYLHSDVSPSPPPAWAVELKTMLTTLTQKEDHMSLEMDNLTASVAASTTVQDSAMTLLTGLKTALDAAIATGNPAAIQAISDSIGSETTKLAAAITANTPAATPPPPPAAAATRR